MIVSAGKVAIPMSDVLILAKALELAHHSNGEFKMMLVNGTYLRVTFQLAGQPAAQYACAIIEIMDAAI